MSSLINIPPFVPRASLARPLDLLTSIAECVRFSFLFFLKKQKTTKQKTRATQPTNQLTSLVIINQLLKPAASDSQVQRSRGLCRWPRVRRPGDRFPLPLEPLR